MWDNKVKRPAFDPIGHFNRPEGQVGVKLKRTLARASLGQRLEEQSMVTMGQCANCGAPLPSDQPADNRYCGKCAAAWQRGPTAGEQSATVEDDSTRTKRGQCANCGAPLPSDQPADNRYCGKCAAAWQRGPTARK